MASHRERQRWFEGREPDEIAWSGPISLELFYDIGAMRFTSYRIEDGKLRPGKCWVCWAEHFRRSPEAFRLLLQFVELARRWPLDAQPDNAPQGRGQGEGANR